MVCTATTGIAQDGLIRFLDAVGHPPAILALDRYPGAKVDSGTGSGTGSGSGTGGG